MPVSQTMRQQLMQGSWTPPTPYFTPSMSNQPDWWLQAFKVIESALEQFGPSFNLTLSEASVFVLEHKQNAAYASAKGSILQSACNVFRFRETIATSGETYNGPNEANLVLAKLRKLLALHVVDDEPFLPYQIKQLKGVQPPAVDLTLHKLSLGSAPDCIIQFHIHSDAKLRIVSSLQQPEEKPFIPYVKPPPPPTVHMQSFYMSWNPKAMPNLKPTVPDSTEE